MVAWHFDNKGNFLVKSAYHVLADEEERKKISRVGESSSTTVKADEKTFWKKIWSLDCLPKVKQFLWWVAHNSLAVKMNLKRRGIKLDTRCPVCLRFDEDGGHCFLKCKMMKKAWRCLHLEGTRVYLMQAQSAKAFVLDVLKLQPNIRSW